MYPIDFYPRAQRKIFYKRTASKNKQVNQRSDPKRLGVLKVPSLDERDDLTSISVLGYFLERKPALAQKAPAFTSKRVAFLILSIYLAYDCQLPKNSANTNWMANSP